VAKGGPILSSIRVEGIEDFCCTLKFVSDELRELVSTWLPAHEGNQIWDHLSKSGRAFSSLVAQ
jgi:hypothetical protein